MPRLVFAEFEAFVDAIRNVDGRYLPTTRNTREWRLRVVELDNATLMVGQGGAANLYQAVGRPDYFSVLLPLSRSETLAVNGRRMGHDSVFWLTPGHEFQFRAYVPLRWLAVNLRCDLVRERMQQGGATFPRQLERNRLFQTPVAAITDLVALARRVLEVDAREPETLASAQARDALSHQFLETILPCLVLDDDVASGPGRPRVERSQVLSRALEIIDVCIGQTLHVEDLCKAARVSPRTLHSVFLEQLGVTPHRYLSLRRLCAIRDAIRNAGADETVTSICTRFGVWDFGRFAGHYRDHFGIPPSADLGKRRRPAV